MSHQNRPFVYLVASGILLAGACIGWWLGQYTGNRLFHAPVVSSSMANAVPGPHFAIECYDCQIPFLVDADTVSESNLPICFNCGAPNSIDDLVTRLPQTTFQVIDEEILTRWQRVVFEYDGQQYIKRVVGLPGEKIAMEQGELFVDGQLYQKSLAEFDLLSTVLFDSRYQPLDSSFNLLRRFGVRGDDQGWIFTTEKVFAFDAPQKTRPQWLDFHHWNVVAGYVPRVERGTDAAIFDYLPYNQYIARSQLNFVDDFVVDLDFRIYEPGVIRIRLLDVELELDCHQFTLQVFQSHFVRHSTSFTPLKWHKLGSEMKLRVGRIDSQFVVELGSDQWAVPIESLGLTGNFGADELVRKMPLSVAVDEGILDLNRVRLARDVFWLGADYSADRWEFRGGSGDKDYLLIGDNQPVSRDCRQWGVGIGREAMLGVGVD